jgi:GNAT superfamily N-acetyltransferase
VTDVLVRTADEADLDALASLWHAGWQDAHAQLLPAALARLRTLDSFRDRLRAVLPTVRVVGAAGAPVGLCMVKGDELYQLFVAAEGRGAGVAAALLADAEQRLAEAGLETAWLACVIGNARAARFYEKSGWRRASTTTIEVETSEGPFPLEVWRYEKALPTVTGPRRDRS